MVKKIDMADDFDVEALLEAPYEKKEVNGEIGKPFEPLRNGEGKSQRDEIEEKENSEAKSSSKSKPRGKSRERHGSKSRRRSRSRHRSTSKSRRSRSKRRSKSRHNSKSKHRSKSPSNKKRSRSRHRSHSKRSRSRHRSRSRERYHHKSRKSRSRSRDRKRRKKSLTPISLPGRREPFPPHPRNRKLSPIRSNPMLDDLTPEERDARTIFCMQLSQKIRSKDLEEFFSSVGKVRDVRLITCNKTRRFKGISYVEFKEPESVTLALGLNGQKLLGIPIVVQPTQAEKNRIGNSMPNLMPRSHPGPVRLYVGSLHYNITEEMLRGIFEPFGKIDSIVLTTDPETGRSKGYGFVTYHNSEDAKKALEQMNGFELAGRPMKVNNVTDRHEFTSSGPSIDDNDDRAGIDLGATGRLQLMYKLAEGTGMQLPPAAANALNLSQQASVPTNPPITTQCFLLSNMFDANAESAPNWEVEIRDDVIEECNLHGGCVHVYVDKTSPEGYVYVKCPTINTAVAAVNSLHGRWFGGRVITAAYVPIINYHNLFPESMGPNLPLLTPSRKMIT